MLEIVSICASVAALVISGFSLGMSYAMGKMLTALEDTYEENTDEQ